MTSSIPKLFQKMIYFNSLDSSNDYLIKLYKKFQLNTELVVVTDKQIKGRGRIGKSWFSDNCSLTFSFSIFLNKEMTTWKICMIVSLALVKILDFHKIRAFIKYPNDIIVNNKKIAGILTELISFKQRKCCIVGVGLNVNNKLFPQNINAVSMKNLIFKTLDKDILLNEIISEINSLFSIKKNIIKFYMSALYGSDIYVKCIYKKTECYVKILSVTQTGLLTILTKKQFIYTVKHTDIRFLIN